MMFERGDLNRFMWVAITFSAIFGLYMVIITTTIALVLPFIVTPAMLYGAVPGVFCAPLAALIQWKMARSQALRPGRYIIAGTLYSVLFVLPWLYMITKLLGSTFPSPVIRTGYVVMYSAWLLGPISVLGLFLFVPAAHSYEIIELEVEGYAVLGSAFVAMSLAWIISLTKLIAREADVVSITPFVGLYTHTYRELTPRNRKSSSHKAQLPDAPLIEFRYVLPILCALISSALFVPLLRLIASFSI